MDHGRTPRSQNKTGWSRPRTRLAGVALTGPLGTPMFCLCSCPWARDVLEGGEGGGALAAPPPPFPPRVPYGPRQRWAENFEA